MSLQRQPLPQPALHHHIRQNPWLFWESLLGAKPAGQNEIAVGVPINFAGNVQVKSNKIFSLIDKLCIEPYKAMTIHQKAYFLETNILNFH